MHKLPQISGRVLVKAFKKMGYEVVSQKGSHIKMANTQGRKVTIPNHRVIKKGTLKKGILNPLNITVEDLIKVLRE
jgi:predicted RNA binding protein YcfA (HicA-like mRNA interferase family)